MRLLKNPVEQAILPVRCDAAVQEHAWERVSSLQKHPFESLRPADRSWFLLAPRRRDARSGLTLIELIVAFTILLILSTMALPLARVRVQREKERRLRDALTEMRKAIDRYKDYADAGKLGQIDPDSFGYPESLEMLVEGVEISGTGGADPLGAMQGASGFGQPAGRNSRSSRNGSGSSRGGFGSSGGGFGSSGGGVGSSRSGSGSSRGGFGSSGGGFGQSNRGSGSSRSGFGSGREGQGGSNAFGEPGRSGSDEEEKKIRFLRRVPVDPITGTADWGLRSVKDPPESMSWGGRNVFDVYSKSMDTALDGTRYSEW